LNKGSVRADKMPAQVHMSKKELLDLIEEGERAGTDTNTLKNFLAELPSEKAARSKPPRTTRRLEPERVPEVLITGPELERLRPLACPHIRGSPYWEEFVSRRVLVCSICQDLRPGEFGELRQPPLF